MIKVAILDDHLMVLEGLQNMLNGTDISVIATFSKGAELLNDLKIKQPDVLLLDINLPDSNGIELCSTISKDYPNVKIIGLSNYNETGFIKNMMRNGAKGYLLKNTTKKELVEAITAAYNDENYLPKKLQDKLLNESFGKESTTFIPKITRREKEILLCIADELTNEEISKKLFISKKTVESHRNSLLQKFGARNTAGLIKKAFSIGLLS